MPSLSALCRFNVRVGNVNVMALGDTGAAASFISERMARKLLAVGCARMRTLPHTVPLYLGDGVTSLPMTRAATFSLKTKRGNEIGEVDAFVAAIDGGHDLILGLPFFLQHNAIWDFTAGELSLVG
jgi:hypothetical protein